MKVFRIAIRVFIFLLLFVFSFAAVYPLIFLLGGSLKSTAVSYTHLRAHET